MILMKRILVYNCVFMSVLGFSHEFFDRPAGQEFLTEFCDTFQYRSVNIFLQNAGGQWSVPANILRGLWRNSTRSVSVKKVNHLHQVVSFLTMDPSTSINVGFIERTQDLEFFINSSDQSLIRNYPWLIFGNVREVLKSAFRPYLSLDNQITFVNVDNTTGSFELVEAYSAARILSAAKMVPPFVQTFGSWSSSNSLVMNLKPWAQRRTNLTGLHIRCVTLEQGPFMYISIPEPNLNVQLIGGYAAEVWHTLQDQLGFTYSCRRSTDNLWGHQSNGVWNGLVRDLLDNAADVVVTSLDHSNSRARAIDFTTGLKEIGYQLVARRPGLMEKTWSSFTSELVPASWLATIGFTVVVPLCLSMCSKISPKETEKINLKDAYILTIGAFSTQGSWLEVKSISTRIVFITIFLATLLIYAHYTSALVSLLTVASTSTGITGLQNLVDVDSYTFGFHRETSIQNAFETATSGLFYDVWTNLVDSNPMNLPRNDSTGIFRVIHTNYVHMIEENLYKDMFRNQCRTVLVPGKYFTQQTGFAVQKGSPLKSIFDAQLLRMRDGGILSRQWALWQPPPPLCTAENVVALDIYQLFTAFLLLAVGIITALVFLPCERLHWNAIGKDMAFQNMMRKPPMNLPPPKKAQKQKRRTNEDTAPSVAPKQQNPPRNIYVNPENPTQTSQRNPWD